MLTLTKICISDLFSENPFQFLDMWTMAMGEFLSLLLAAAVVAGLSMSGGEAQKLGEEAVAGTPPYRIHTLFSVECQNYFDWQTVGLMHSFRKAQQPGPVTRLLSCTEEEKKTYRGMDLAPTLEVPSMSRHPKTGDWWVQMCIYIHSIHIMHVCIHSKLYYFAL